MLPQPLRIHPHPSVHCSGCTPASLARACLGATHFRKSPSKSKLSLLFDNCMAQHHVTLQHTPDVRGEHVCCLPGTGTLYKTYLLNMACLLSFTARYRPLSTWLARGCWRLSHRLTPAIHNIIFLPPLNPLHGCFQLVVCSLVDLVLHSMTACISTLPSRAFTLHRSAG